MRSSFFVNRITVAALLTFTAAVLAFAPLIWRLGERYLKFDETYSHGLLLLAVSVFLVIRRVRSTKLVTVFQPIWLAPLGLMLIGFWSASLLRIQVVQDVLFVPILLAALLTILGWRQGRGLFIPIGILMLGMPFWDFFAWPLQMITVAINHVLLGIWGIDFRVEGVFVYLIGVGSFEVAHGCSGLRYLLIGQVLALIYGELNYRTVSPRVKLYLVAVFLALAANWIRVFVIFAMGYVTDMQTGLIEDHEAFGWWVFAGTLVPLFWYASRLERTEPTVEKTASGIVLQAGRGGSISYVVISAMFLLLWIGQGQPSPLEVERSDALVIELQSPSYGSLFRSGLAEWKPQVRNADFVTERTFFPIGGDPSAALFVGVYSYSLQRNKAELIQYANRLYDGGVWRVEGTFELTLSDGHAFHGLDLRHRGTGEFTSIAYGYYVGGVWTTDKILAKVLQIRSIFSGRDDAELIVVGVQCDDCDKQQELAAILDTHGSDIMTKIDNWADR